MILRPTGRAAGVLGAYMSCRFCLARHALEPTSAHVRSRRDPSLSTPLSALTSPRRLVAERLRENAKTPEEERGAGLPFRSLQTLCTALAFAGEVRCAPMDACSQRRALSLNANPKISSPLPTLPAFWRFKLSGAAGREHRFPTGCDACRTPSGITKRVDRPPVRALTILFRPRALCSAADASRLDSTRDFSGERF